MIRLVIAPHADDEVMGCGGLLAKYPEECSVVVCAAMDAEREGEFASAMRVLGYAGCVMLGLPDGRVGDDMPALVTTLDRVLDRIRPDEVYLPFPSMHQDHVAVYEAGMRACRLSMKEEHWFPSDVLVYDIAAYDVNLYPSDLRWNVFEPLDWEQVSAKSMAVKAYDSQIAAGAHPVNGVREAAHATGAARGLDYAEQYALVRSVRR